MNIGSLLSDAATIMLIGMVVVFLFLTILICLVQLMSKLAPEQLPQTPPNIDSVSETDINPKIVAAISAAIHQHRIATTK